MRNLVLGDIHGNHKALLQVLGRSKFSDSDTLIFLGDVCDRWPDTDKCVTTLMSIKNRVLIEGNHDTWWIAWGLRRWDVNPLWRNQGGLQTMITFSEYLDEDLKTFVSLYKQELVPYYIDAKNRLFVHGGIFDHRFRHPRELDPDDMRWDRELVDLYMGGIEIGTYKAMLDHYKTAFEEIYVGHTSTVYYDTDKPINKHNFWMLDTGCGAKGKLTIMDVDTKEYWQSDHVEEMYDTPW